MLCQPISSGGNWKLFVTLIKWTVKISWQIRWALVWWTKFRRSSPPFSHFCFPQFPQCFPRWKRGYPVELESFLLFSTFLPTAFPKNMLSKHNRFTAFFCGFTPFSPLIAFIFHRIRRMCKTQWNKTVALVYIILLFFQGFFHFPPFSFHGTFKGKKPPWNNEFLFTVLSTVGGQQKPRITALFRPFPPFAPPLLLILK